MPVDMIAKRSSDSFSIFIQRPAIRELIGKKQGGLSSFRIEAADLFNQFGNALWMAF